MLKIDPKFHQWRKNVILAIFGSLLRTHTCGARRYLYQANNTWLIWITVYFFCKNQGHLLLNYQSLTKKTQQQHPIPTKGWCHCKTRWNRMGKWFDPRENENLKLHNPSIMDQWEAHCGWEYLYCSTCWYSCPGQLFFFFIPWKKNLEFFTY